MLKLARVIRNYAETGALNENIALFGLIDEHTFLTKQGDVGVVLRVEGVDYECLDTSAIDQLTKRLENAFKLFDGKFRVYQYLFKSNRPEIPFTAHGNEIVNAALEDRREYFRRKADKLYAIEIYYVIVYEGFRYQSSSLGSVTKLLSSPRLAWQEAAGLFSTEKQVVLIIDEIERARRILRERVQHFLAQGSDFVKAELVVKQDAFRVFKRLLNFNPAKVANARLKYDTHVDFFLADSAIECYSDHLQMDNYYVRVLTLKEPTSQSWPLIFKQLYEIGANFHVVTEWQPRGNAEARKRIQSARRHFHNTKTSLMSQVAADNSARAGDVLVDDSKESLVNSLGECLKEIELNGNHFGAFSLTIVVYGLDAQAVDKACGEFYKVFSINDGGVYEERYNLLNAFFATLPGNYHFNLRYLDILNTNYADYSFLFRLHTGDRHNRYLDREYLALLETNQGTPYFFNLHYMDTAHTLVLGRTGAGKSFLLNFLITNLQKYDPYTFIFDLGGSYRSLTQLFKGSYLRVGSSQQAFTINPFCLPSTPENLQFLFSLLKVLIEGNRQYQLTQEDERELYATLENLYHLDPSIRRMNTLAAILRRDLGDRLHKWIEGGAYGFLFDNPEDTLTFSRFQCFDFEGMEQSKDALEPLLFYILHRASSVIRDPKLGLTFKAFFMDEAWRFFSHPTIRSYMVEALKTWRKKNAAMILATQSVDELRKLEVLDVVLESCATKIFLANPDLDPELYRQIFHLNGSEIEMIASLIPKQQMLIKRPDMAKRAKLHVDGKSYWLYTNNPQDNARREEAFRAHGFHQGLEILTRSNREQ